MKKIMMLIVAITSLNSCISQSKKEVTTKATNFAVVKTESEWKKELTEEQFDVLRQKGTEAPFTGQYYQHDKKGIYTCAGCQNPLFTSSAKFNTECGWPSFDQAIKGSVIYKTDGTFGMQRTEVMCAKCGGHLGHVFDDGPAETTGQRFCTNSVSINFIPKP
jgi:peptide-methionine (R)-S-oxide reductase